MKSCRNFVAAFALLAAFAASPASADWNTPGGGVGPVEAGEELFVAAQWGFQILQVAL